MDAPWGVGAPREVSFGVRRAEARPLRVLKEIRVDAPLGVGAPSELSFGVRWR